MPVAAERQRGDGQQRDDERHRQAMDDADRRERDRHSVEVLGKQHRDVEGNFAKQVSAREHTVVSRPSASFLVASRGWRYYRLRRCERAWGDVWSFAAKRS